MSVLKSLCLSYLEHLRTQRAQANTTGELSYREFLGAFLRDAGQRLGAAAHFTHEGKQIAVGRPDYEVRQGLRVIGYVEAEALETPLSQLKGHAKEQNARFRQNLHNFLLTNHLQFQLFVDGSLVESASLGDLPDQGAPLHLSDGALADLERLLTRFLDGTTPSAVTAADVARQLAKRARLLRAVAQELLARPESPLHPFWNAYRQTLYSDLSAEKFADVYAQTFTYGLFLAWLSTDVTPFDRRVAIDAIPEAVPPIQALLEFGGTRKMPAELAWIVDGICQDLDAADRAGVMRPFAQTGDPMVHFYETFLAAYDPAQRERVGVYYTPDAVVEFIVRAVDDTLKAEFGKPAGLADPSVLLLDPATGTATFLAHAYRHVHAALLARGDAGVWPDVARDHLARHFNGFELLPAAYTLAHLKLRQLLTELGAPPAEDAHLPIYLTNTLDEGMTRGERLPMVDVLAEEAKHAAYVKNDEAILVVLGNPPYSGHSANPSRNDKGELTFIGKLIQDYFQVDGRPLGEKNPKWLQDDYVKFLRFAQWRIEKTGHGIVAFITNHGYLDNPTFRGMRQSLMRTFDALYLYDLHGNAKKKERALDGTEDKNVFDIQQGVAICVLVKRPQDGVAPPAPNSGGAGRKSAPSAPSSSLPPPELGAGGRSSPRLFHADLYGSRPAKYAALRAATLNTVPWTQLHPTAPFYLFRPQDQDVREEYEQGWSVTEVFQVNTVGIVTGQDSETIAFTRTEAEMLATKHGLLPTVIEPLLYRPFDCRHIVYSSTVVTRPRTEVMRQMLGSRNLGLITTRMTKEEWDCFVSDALVGHKSASVYDIGSLFPLYRYPTENEAAMGMEREANLEPQFLQELTECLGETPTPEEIFHYIYGLFHAPAYRARYAAFLKGDFPRVPRPPDRAAFDAAVRVGARLVALHLLQAPALDNTGIGYPVAGDHDVQKRKADARYQPPTDTQPGRIRLNAAQYFDNVPPEAWAFRVGGYQPAAKWLDDRAGRRLTLDEITHYRRALAAMRETVVLLPEADAAFDAVRGASATTLP